MQVAAPPAPAPVTITFRLRDADADPNDNGTSHRGGDGAVWVPDPTPVGPGEDGA